jgi:hypothetical protein
LSNPKIDGIRAKVIDDMGKYGEDIKKLNENFDQLQGVL